MKQFLPISIGILFNHILKLSILAGLLLFSAAPPVSADSLSTSHHAENGSDGSWRVDGPDQVLRISGSDTMLNISRIWANTFMKQRKRTGKRHVQVHVQGGGSGFGLGKLLDGLSDIANFSRALSPREIHMVRIGRLNLIPSVVGYDALVALFLHRANPISKLSLSQLAEIYGVDGSLTHWHQLGITVPGCPDQRIVPISRQNDSGTFSFFKSTVLGEERDYRTDLTFASSNTDVVVQVRENPCAIGYGGMRFGTNEIKMGCLSVEEGEPCISPDHSHEAVKNYPITRPLYVITQGSPRGVVKEYLDWIRGKAGQCILVRMGYTPVDPAIKCH